MNKRRCGCCGCYREVIISGARVLNYHKQIELGLIPLCLVCFHKAIGYEVDFKDYPEKFVNTIDD